MAEGDNEHADIGSLVERGILRAHTDDAENELNFRYIMFCAKINIGADVSFQKEMLRRFAWQETSLMEDHLADDICKMFGLNCDHCNSRLIYATMQQSILTAKNNLQSGHYPNGPLKDFALQRYLILIATKKIADMEIFGNKKGWA